MAELRSEAPDESPRLHRRAATWFADHGDEARGLVHAVEAEAWDLAARLAGERWVDLLIRGDVGALEPLIERLPVEWVEAGSRAGAGGRERAAGARRPRRRPTVLLGHAERRRGACAARAPRSASPCPSRRCGCTSRASAGTSTGAIELGRALSA